MKNMEKLFDLVCHRNDTETRDLPFDGVPAQAQDAIIQKSIQAFMHGTGMPAFDNRGNVVPFDTRRPIQAFSGSADLPILTKDVFSVTEKTPNFDLAWQSAFKGMTLRKGQLAWEITDVSTTGGFTLIPEGGKVKIRDLAGNTASVGINKYGYGLGVTWEIMEGRKLYAFIDMMDQARAKLYLNWADTHYALLNTGAAVNAVAWVAGATTLDRDIATLNAAAYAIANATKDSGYGDTANTPMILYISPKYRARMEQAMQAVRGDINAGRITGAGSSTEIVDWNIEVRYTFNGAVTADKGNMILPGNKIQNAVYLRELGLSRQEIESLSEVRTYWTAYGAAVGDTDQCAQLSFS